MNRRLLVALAVSAALALGLVAARAVSRPERSVVPVIQVDRGQITPGSAPTSEPARGPGTTAQPVEAPPPPVRPAQSPVIPSVSPESSTPGTVTGDDNDDDPADADDDDDRSGDDGGDDDDDD